MSKTVKNRIGRIDTDVVFDMAPDEYGVYRAVGRSRSRNKSRDRQVQSKEVKARCKTQHAAPPAAYAPVQLQQSSVQQDVECFLSGIAQVIDMIDRAARVLKRLEG